MADLATCLWCPTQFPPKTVGGHEKEFCCPKCKATAHAAEREFGAALVQDARGVIRAWLSGQAPRGHVGVVCDGGGGV